MRLCSPCAYILLWRTSSLLVAAGDHRCQGPHHWTLEFKSDKVRYQTASRRVEPNHSLKLSKMCQINAKNPSDHKSLQLPDISMTSWSHRRTAHWNLWSYDQALTRIAALMVHGKHRTRCTWSTWSGIWDWPYVGRLSKAKLERNNGVHQLSEKLFSFSKKIWWSRNTHASHQSCSPTGSASRKTH